MAVANNILFDPSKEELAVADAALAVSVTSSTRSDENDDGDGDDSMDVREKKGRNLRLLSIRTVDPPSRLTPPGVANSSNAAYGVASNGNGKAAEGKTAVAEGEAVVEGVWRAPRGGAKRAVMAALVQKALERGGVVDEVFDALEGVELG
jgi:exosome complex component RRP42